VGRHHHAPGNHVPVLLHQLPRGNPSPPLWGTVRRGRCQPRDTAPPTLVRLTCRALEGGPATPSNHFLMNLQGQVMTLGRRDAIPTTVGRVRPPPCSQHHAGHVTTTPAPCGTRGRDAATPITVPRTDRRQRLPQAFLKTPRPATTPLPSKLPLFGYKVHHDDQIVARTVKAAAYSVALHTILPHVAE
jgi:hypothetical protein